MNEHEIVTAALHLPPQVGITCLKTGQFARAEPLLRKNMGNANAYLILFGESDLGQVLLGNKKFAESHRLLTQGYEGLKQHRDELPTIEWALSRKPVDFTSTLTKLTKPPSGAELDKAKAKLEQDKVKQQTEASAQRK